MHRLPVIFTALMLLLPCRLSAQRSTVPVHVLDSIANPPVDTLASLVFDRLLVNLGELKDDAEPVRTVFRATNMGSSALSLRRVASSCGCAVALCDTLPIAPGGSTEICVIYNPKGQSGRQLRKVYVYTDKSSVHPSAVIAVEATVTPGAVPRGLPYKMGTLFCSRTSVSFRFENGQARATERISCMNKGSSPIRISAMPGFLPEWLSLRTDPETIEPGGTGDIVLVVDRSRLPSAEGTAKVILNGIDARPSQRTVEIIYETENEQQ